MNISNCHPGRATGIVVVVAILYLTLLHTHIKKQDSSSDARFAVVNSGCLRLIDKVYNINGAMTFLIKPKGRASEWLYIEDWHFGTGITIHDFKIRTDMSGRISVADGQEYEILEGCPILLRMWNDEFCVNFQTRSGYKSIYKDFHDKIYHIGVSASQPLRVRIKSNWYEFL